eukprot:scaffold7714_cov25-Tisochrysis_lutea.AAC.7
MRRKRGRAPSPSFGGGNAHRDSSHVLTASAWGVAGSSSKDRKGDARSQSCGSDAMSRRYPSETSASIRAASATVAAESFSASTACDALGGGGGGGGSRWAGRSSSASERGGAGGWSSSGRRFNCGAMRQTTLDAGTSVLPRGRSDCSRAALLMMSRSRELSSSADSAAAKAHQTRTTFELLDTASGAMAVVEASLLGGAAARSVTTSCNILRKRCIGEGGGAVPHPK